MIEFNLFAAVVHAFGCMLCFLAYTFLAIAIYLFWELFIYIIKNVWRKIRK